MIFSESFMNIFSFDFTRISCFSEPRTTSSATLIAASVESREVGTFRLVRVLSLLAFDIYDLGEALLGAMFAKAFSSVENVYLLRLSAIRPFGRTHLQ